ncbi:MAG: holo-ACP synthase [Stenotrophobium sp.]
MISGIGVDILRLERMQKVWTRHGERLPEKILCEAELAEFARSKNPVRFLAMAFAAKEACVKALGTGFHGVGYRDVGSVHEASGKPVLVFSPRLQERLRELGIGASHVSLTDEGGLICAMVVLERL